MGTEQNEALGVPAPGSAHSECPRRCRGGEDPAAEGVRAFEAVSGWVLWEVDPR